MCPLSVTAGAYVRTSQRTRKPSICFQPTCFSFLHTFSSPHTFLPVHNFPQVLPSTKLSSINHDSHLHLSGFSPLRKILTVNHYLRNQDFQHCSLLWLRVIPRDHLRHPLSPLRIFAPLLPSFSVSSLHSFSLLILFLFNKQYKPFAFSGDHSPFELVELLASTPSHPIALNIAGS